MKKSASVALLFASALLLAACGDRVEVPPAHVGKVLTKNGFKPETIPPSKFRLEPCVFYCDRLIVAEAADIGMKEKFRLFMPRDQLNMAFDIRFTMSIKTDEKSLDTIYSRVPANKNGFIPARRVYTTYGQPVLREIIRTVVAAYQINEVASSRAKINAEVFAAVQKALENTPVTVKRLAFADIQFPEVIVKAKEMAAQRRAAIQQAEAEKQITLVRVQAELEKARAERAVRREKAEAAREENRIFAESVTERYLQYKRLEVLQALANNPNSVFVPFDALGTVGLSMRMFGTDPDKKRRQAKVVNP